MLSTDLLWSPPGEAKDGRPYCASGNAEEPGELSVPNSGGVKRAHLGHHFRGQLRYGELDPAGCSSLAGRVPHIVRSGSEEEMVGPDAVRNIAGMADVVPVWLVSSVRFLPAKHVDGDVSLAPGSYPYDSIGRDSVAVLDSRSRPQPTPIGLMNLGPHAGDGRAGTTRQKSPGGSISGHHDSPDRDDAPPAVSAARGHSLGHILP